MSQQPRSPESQSAPAPEFVPESEFAPESVPESVPESGPESGAPCPEPAPAAASAGGTGGGSDRLGRAFHGGDLSALRRVSPIAACLVELLDALRWRGEPRRVYEALPHFADTLEIGDLVRVFANLNYAAFSVKLGADSLDPRLLPCLVVRKGQAPIVVLRYEGQAFKVYDGEQRRIVALDRHQVTGVAYFFAPAEEDGWNRTEDPQATWLGAFVRRFHGPMWRMVGVVWMNSLLALALPLFTLAIYDWVIPGGSVDALLLLGAGVSFVFAVDIALRALRLRHLAYTGGRIDNLMGTQAFQHLLHLPLALTERAPVGVQLARLRQFETIRDFFTGPLANIVFELPFTLVFLVALIWLGGELAWGATILALTFVLAALAIGPAMKRSALASGDSRALKQAFLTEMIINLRPIKGLGAEETWQERFRDLSARAAISGFRSAQLTSLVQTVAQALMIAAGTATLIHGAMLVAYDQMTVGALVAAMALTWRMLGPLQTGFLSVFGLEQMRQGAAQLNRLMRLKPERPPRRIATGHRTLHGEIAFQRVSMRYGQFGEPALMGIDFTAQPREVIAITGPSGAGKSTILKLIGGLYHAQAGAVLIDGIDIRQLDCAELRNVIAYLPQACHFFHGTIAQNLRLAEPTAGDDALTEAARDAGVLDDILALPQGFDTRLDHKLRPHLPSGFLQRLMLARTYVRYSCIYLFDEPIKTLDAAGEAAFLRKLGELRSRASVVIVTHRRNHIELADRVLYMESGRILLAGTAPEVLARLRTG